MEPNAIKPAGSPSHHLSPSPPSMSALTLCNRLSPDELRRLSHRSEEDPETIMQRRVQLPDVQEAFPDLLSFEETHQFKSYFLTQPVSTEPRKLKDTFIHFAIILDRHERKADIWKQEYKNSRLTLKKLLHKFHEKSKKIAHESLIGLGIHSFEDQAIDIMNDDQDARAERDLGLPEFEDLYYLLACKARELYSHLQVRFASGWITQDTVLYQEKDRNANSNQTSRESCTVRGLRNAIRALWFQLVHPHVVRILETAINKRKYQSLKAHPLVPINFDDEHEAKYEKYKIGSNLDPPVLSAMFKHLEDVSKVPIPHLLQKIDSRTSVYQVPPFSAAATSILEPSSAKVEPGSNSWIKLRNGEESYIKQEIERAEESSGPEEYRQGKTPTIVLRPPPRKSSLMPTAEIVPLSPTSRLNKKAGSPMTDIKVQKWFPEAVPLAEVRSRTSRSNASSHTPPVSPMVTTFHSDTSSSRTPISPLSKATSHSTDSRITMASPSSKYSRSNASYKAHTATSPTSKSSGSVYSTTPSTAMKTQPITYSPSSRRLPFHGSDEYHLPPPFLPPKSPEQIARAAHAARAKEVREREMRNENVRLKRENSQLQEALQQSHTHGRLQRDTSQMHMSLQAQTPERVQRENSQLQEAFQQVQAQERLKRENNQRQVALQKFQVHERAQRENCELQETTQQAQCYPQKLKRGQSGLQEALQKIHSSPRGLINQLSKAGSRARSKSPFKSSRKSLTNPDAEMSTFDMRGRGRTSFG